MAGSVENTVQLKNGRRIGYAQYGPGDGQPVLFFPGQPGNRLFHPPVLDPVRLLSLDRPGYGLSDFQPGRRLLDWPVDVLEFAEILGIKNFAVVGFSGGGPYALACASALSNRVSSVTVVSCPAPLTVSEIRQQSSRLVRINAWLAQAAPGMMHSLFRAFWKSSRRKPEGFVKLALRQSSPADRLILQSPGNYAMLMETWQENLRVDSAGYVLDAKLLTGEWGFSLQQIPTRVYLWQGEADLNVPVANGRYLASTIPNCSATFVPNAGHFVLFECWQAIVNQIIETSGQTQE